MRIEAAPTHNVAARWKAKYFVGGKWRSTVGGDSQQTYDRLVALGDNPSADDVAKIISISWVSLWCDNCANWHRVAVKFGDDGCLCFGCVRQAMDLVNSVMIEKPVADAKRSKERLIEVLRSVNGHVWPGAASTFKVAADVLERRDGREVEGERNLYESLRTLIAIHQSEYIRDLGWRVLNCIEGKT